MVLTMVMAAMASGTADGFIDLHPGPAARVDWFDLQATQAFSPFPTMVVRDLRSGTPSPDPVPAIRPVNPERPKGPAVVVEHVARPSQVVVVVQHPPTVVEPVERVDPCADRTALELSSSMGRLDPAATTCLMEARASGSQVERNQASRMLLKDAAGKNQPLEPLLTYHLEQIDQSDPNLALELARRLAKRGEMVKAQRYAELALETRQAWTGPTFKERVSESYQLRAEAAHARWMSLAGAAPDETSLKRGDDARAMAKTAAREWLDYARSAGAPTARAAELCASAAGTRGFCEP